MTTEFTDESLESLLVINEEDLIDEWANQPIRYINVVRLCARTQAELTNQKVALDTLKATRTLTAKSKGIPGIDRVTDSAITAWIDTDAEVLSTIENITNTTHRLTILEGLKRAYEQRERSLKYIQMLRSMPLTDEDRELGRSARNTALQKYLED